MYKVGATPWSRVASYFKIYEELATKNERYLTPSGSFAQIHWKRVMLVYLLSMYRVQPLVKDAGRLTDRKCGKGFDNVIFDGRKTKCREMHFIYEIWKMNFFWNVCGSGKFGMRYSLELALNIA